MHASRFATSVAALLIGAAVAGWCGSAWAQSHNKTIYSFRATDGSIPLISPLTPDAAGNLYGFDAAAGLRLAKCKSLGINGRCGTIFRLHPTAPKGPGWVRETLYRFTGGADGLSPDFNCKPWVDALGNVYGLANTHSAYRTIFELSPPTIPGGAWTLQTLHNLTGGQDGGNADAGLLMDSSGTLYGTAFDGGTHDKGVVYSLTPPPPGGADWTEAVLYSFGSHEDDGAAPFTPVALGANGDLFGTTEGTSPPNGCGTVYRLHHGANGWRETVLHRFTCGVDGADPSDVLVDRGNRLFGTTINGGASGDGVVFQLLPPTIRQMPWTEQVLHSFDGADGANPIATVVAIHGINALFGITFNNGSGPSSGTGTVFRLDPPASGSGPWTLSTLTVFTGTDHTPGPAGHPGSLTAGRHRLLFGVAGDGGKFGLGTVFSQNPE